MAWSRLSEDVSMSSLGWKVESRTITLAIKAWRTSFPSRLRRVSSLTWCRSVTCPMRSQYSCLSQGNSLRFYQSLRCLKCLTWQKMSTTWLQPSTRWPLWSSIWLMWSRPTDPSDRIRSAALYRLKKLVKLRWHSSKSWEELTQICKISTRLISLCLLRHLKRGC